MITDLPRAKTLLTTKATLTATHIKNNRHLVAAGMFPTVELRLSIKYQLHESEEPEDLEELLEMRASKGFGSLGKVACPGCAELDEDEICPWCRGAGIVAVNTWDTWFEEERGCKTHEPGCERGCPNTSCPHDEIRCFFDVPVLVLEARIGGDWNDRGNSMQGFRLAGLAAHPVALTRYLSLVAASLGFGLLCD